MVKRGLHGLPWIQGGHGGTLGDDDLGATLAVMGFLQEYIAVQAFGQVHVAGDKGVFAALHVDEFPRGHFFQVELRLRLGLQCVAGAIGPGTAEYGDKAGDQRDDQGQFQHGLQDASAADASGVQGAHFGVPIEASYGGKDREKECRG